MAIVQFVLALFNGTTVCGTTTFCADRLSRDGRRDDDDRGTAQGDPADALSAAGNADLHALVRGLPAEPAPHRRPCRCHDRLSASCSPRLRCGAAILRTR